MSAIERRRSWCESLHVELHNVPMVVEINHDSDNECWNWRVTPRGPWWMPVRRFVRAPSREDAIALAFAEAKRTALALVNGGAP